VGRGITGNEGGRLLSFQGERLSLERKWTTEGTSDKRNGRACRRDRTGNKKRSEHGREFKPSARGRLGGEKKGQLVEGQEVNCVVFRWRGGENKIAAISRAGSGKNQKATEKECDEEAPSLEPPDSGTAGGTGIAKGGVGQA